jgi:hypothetical protein
MTPGGILLATLRFAAWEAVVFAASWKIARRLGFEAAEFWLAVLAIEVTIESSIAGLLSFAGWNSPAAYIGVAVALLLLFVRRTPWSARDPLVPLLGPNRPSAGGRPGGRPADRGVCPTMAALAAPLVLLAFRPVEEIDSINYLHYLIDWMGNRATPYTFATNYVAFWELSFLPAWMVTRVDLFFPLLALKGVVLLAMAVWLVGRELGLRGPLLAWTVFAALTMRHYWFEYSGVPTLKNDALHGAGFALLTLVVVRAARRLERADMLLLAFGAAFASVKYTGIFFACIAAAIVAWRARPKPAWWAAGIAVFLATSGHYYVHNLLAYGSPFYPFQINLAFIHLPGTADLSYSSILYNLRDPRLWRALFAPAGGVSPAGLLFPAILAGALAASVWRSARALWRRKWEPADWVAVCLLCGWMLYFRSVYSACAGPGDLAFILNNLNSVRYVDGVLAVSEVFLVSLLAPSRVWLAALLVGINGASRLAMLYGKESFPPMVLIAAAGAALALCFRPRLRWAAAAALVIGAPWLVEWNRAGWTAYWDDLKPALARVRGKGLAVLALEDGGYFAGHVVAAGNPVDPAVRALLPDEVAAAAPPNLAVLVTPGSEAAGMWKSRYNKQIQGWGYRLIVETKSGALFEKQHIPVQ